MRFGDRNRMACVSSTTGTGAYVIGDAVPGFSSPSTLADNTVIEGRVIYGSKWECGSYTKIGLTLVRTAIYETDAGLGNSPVDWGPGDKTFSVTPLAENKIYSPDGSLTISDNPANGHTEAFGLTLEDVREDIVDKVTAGIDLKKTGNLVTGLTLDNLRSSKVEEDATTISIDLSKLTGGSTHAVKVQGNRTLAFTGGTIGQEFLIKLDYDQVGGRKVTWPANLKWVNHYTPETTPVGGGSDTFKFQMVEFKQEVVPTTDPVTYEDYPIGGVYDYLGWILSTERPVIIDLEALPDVSATITTITQGSPGGDNEIQYLSATVDQDYMEFRLFRIDSVTGGTFDLTLQKNAGPSYPVTLIPYNATIKEILRQIWTQTPFTQTQINVGSGVNGADCDDQLNVETEVKLVLLGADRYEGWVISIDPQNLTGGGIYDVDAVSTNGGSQAWNSFIPPPPDSDPFTSDLRPGGFKLTFQGQTTDLIPWQETPPSSLDPLSLSNHGRLIREALENLSTIGVGNIQVIAKDWGVYCFEFIGTKRNTNISGEIQYDPTFLPTNTVGTAFGQVYGTTQNGKTPVAVDEVQRLTVTGNPVSGYLNLTILGNVVRIDIPSEEELQSLNEPGADPRYIHGTKEYITGLLSSLPGFYSGGTSTFNFSVTGGPIPTAPIVITFLSGLGGQNVADSSVVAVGTGVVIDHSICEGARVNFRAGVGGSSSTYAIEHRNPIPGKTVQVTFNNVGSDFEAGFTVIRQGRPATGPNDIPPNLPPRNELVEFAITESPLPSSGNVVVYILRKRITWAWNATNSEVKAAIEAVIGDGVDVTLGPLPGTPIQIEFINDFATEDILHCIVVYPATGTVTWEGVPTYWKNATLPILTPNIPLQYLEFYDTTTELILGKFWHHTGEGGGSGGTYLPGIGIEIEDHGDGTLTIDRLQTTTIDPDSSTIIINLEADSGEDHVFTIAGNRNVDVVNEMLGEHFSIQCFQGGTGNYSLTYLFDVEWAEGFQPVQTPVVGKSDLFHFLCLEASGPYNVARFRGWVETTERPQPNDLTCSSDQVAVLVETIQEAAVGEDEVQELELFGSPTGGTFTLRFFGQTTPGIDFDATSTLVMQALWTLSNIEPGDIICAGGPFPDNPITVTFLQAYHWTNVPQLILDPTNLTGGSIAAEIETITEGDDGTITVVWDSLTDPSPWNCPNDIIDSVASVECWGGGQGGSTAQGGIGSDYSKTFSQAVTPGDSYNVTVGNGGSGSSSSSNNPGESTSFLGTTALGGGSITGFPAGDLFFRGGQGGTPLDPLFQFAGGGSSAGSNSNGVNGLDGVDGGQGGIAPTDGGNGGDGTGTGSFPGDIPGGGGGCYVAGGGAGGGGRVRITYRTPGGVATNEVQQLSETGSPSQGTFKLEGRTLNYNASVSEVQAELDIVFGDGATNCTGGPLPDTPIDIEFTGSLGFTNVDPLTIDDDKLQYAVMTTTQGLAGINEKQRLTLFPDSGSGTFTLTLDTETTADLDWDSTNAEIKAELETFAAIDDVTITGGPFYDAPIVIEFKGIQASVDVSLLECDVSLLTADTSNPCLIDWSICDFAVVTLNPGSGTYLIGHKNLIVGKVIHVTIKNPNNASGSFDWDFNGITVDWGVSGAPALPADDEEIELVFRAKSLTEITGKLWLPQSNDGVTQIEEEPSGAIDGNNLVFTLSQVPATNSLFLFLNGLVQWRSISGSYMLSGDTITFNTGCAPPSGSVLMANYRV